jgi:hypothetical protein
VSTEVGEVHGHLIAGTALPEGQMSVGGLGELFMDQIRAEHVETWKAGIVQLINGGHYSPHTANGWLSVLRVIDRAAKRDLRLAVSFTEGVRDFDTSDHVTYSEESPNALAPEMLPGVPRGAAGDVPAALSDHERVSIARLRQLLAAKDDGEGAGSASHSGCDDASHEGVIVPSESRTEHSADPALALPGPAAIPLPPSLRASGARPRPPGLCRAWPSPC